MVIKKSKRAKNFALQIAFFASVWLGELQHKQFIDCYQFCHNGLIENHYGNNQFIKNNRLLLIINYKLSYSRRWAIMIWAIIIKNYYYLIIITKENVVNPSFLYSGLR